MRSIQFPVVAMVMAAAIAGTQAKAAPEEIQVYMDEMNDPGHFGLDLHVNDVLQGDAAPDHPGAETSLHRWRVTPEFAYALNGQFEVGAYLPLATIAPDGVFRAEGVKFRLKWLAPHKAEGFYWGANYEIGRESYRLDRNPWNNEIKLIGGWRRGRWLAALNGNIDFTVSGPDPSPATFELASKMGYRLTPGFTLGIESYNELGPIKDPGHLAQNEHSTYLVADTHLGAWDLNAGLGEGYGGNGDHLILKFVIGVPIGHRTH